MTVGVCEKRLNTSPSPPAPSPLRVSVGTDRFETGREFLNVVHIKRGFLEKMLTAVFSNTAGKEPDSEVSLIMCVAVG